MSVRRRTKSESSLKNGITLPPLEENQVYCSIPRHCNNGHVIDLDQREESARLSCTNTQCDQSHLIHQSCLKAWEDELITILRATSRARSWPEKQCRTNLWTKKGYELVYKSCLCKCKNGYIKKDIMEAPSLENGFEEQKKGRRRQRKERPTSLKPIPSLLPVHGRSPGMKTSNSFGESSSYSSSLDSLSSPCGSSARRIQSSDKTTPVTFPRRSDYQVFEDCISRTRHNNFHVKVDDDGHDDLKTLVHSVFGVQRQNSVQCIVCSLRLTIYDRYPLLDGLFFLSPIKHHECSLAVTFSKKKMFLSAVCIYCLENKRHSSLTCRKCSRRWPSHCLQIGVVYMFDIFAAQPCCQARYVCKQCGQFVQDYNKLVTFSFSQYSQSLQCKFCFKNDYHFVRPLHILYQQAAT